MVVTSLNLRFFPTLVALMLTAALAVFGDESGSVRRPAADRPDVDRNSIWPVPIAVPALPNAYWIHERVISGGLPEAEGMQSLKQLGVKTIISVDGATPDVATAHKYGLKYVHLPHGYSGISTQRSLELAKAVRDSKGPVYLHCHHGKHRSPAAAATACIIAGLIDARDGERILKIAGTSEHYRGLFQTVERASRVEHHILDELAVEFKEVADVPPFAEAMVEMDHTFDRLRVLQRNEWTKSDLDPDSDLVHEALILREHFTELLRTENVKTRPPEFVSLLKQGHSLAGQFESTAREVELSSRGEQLSRRLEAISTNCLKCHQRYRDVPLRTVGQ